MKCTNPVAGDSPPIPTLDLDQIVSEWAIKAAAYARAQVTPLYGPDNTPTSYERGMIQQVAATYRDGYLAACESVRAALARRSGETP